VIAPLGAKILALPTAERARLAARLIDAGQLPEIALLLLDGVIVDVMKLCIAHEANWQEEPLH
jgi:hypothetical protein